MNRTSASGATFPVYSPSTGRVIAEVPDMKEEDADTVIREAYQSQKAWGATIAKVSSALSSAGTFYVQCSRPLQLNSLFPVLCHYTFLWAG